MEVVVVGSRERVEVERIGKGLVTVVEPLMAVGSKTRPVALERVAESTVTAEFSRPAPVGAATSVGTVSCRFVGRIRAIGGG